MLKHMILRDQIGRPLIIDGDRVEAICGRMLRASEALYAEGDECGACALELVRTRIRISRLRQTYWDEHDRAAACRRGA